jgi:hypothetical protein
MPAKKKAGQKARHKHSRKDIPIIGDCIDLQGHQRDHDEYVDGDYDERKNRQLSALTRAGRGALHAKVVQSKSRHKKPP